MYHTVVVDIYAAMSSLEEQWNKNVIHQLNKSVLCLPLSVAYLPAAFFPGTFLQLNWLQTLAEENPLKNSSGVSGMFGEDPGPLSFVL